MSIFNMIGSYEDAWKAIIMPPRQDYSIHDLGPTEFSVKNNRIKRTDFRLLNKRGQTLECSFYQQCNIDKPIPCIVYLHANGCCRLEALHYLDAVLSNQVSFFCFDFSGCGKSDGFYTSIGWFEQDDLECVIQYLFNTDKVSKLGVWGRSMGAVTALMYASKDPRISCLIFDSPFANFKQLVKELAQQKANLPGFIITGAFNIVRNTISKKANFDINELRPIRHVGKIRVPTLFGAAKDDTFVYPEHTKELYKAHGGGHKQIMIFDGDHNSQRPFQWTILAKDFIRAHLLGEKVEFPQPQPVVNPVKQPSNAGERLHEHTSNLMKEVELHKQHSQPAAAKKTSSPPRKLQEGQMVFSWLEHSNSSPNLVMTNKPEVSGFKNNNVKEPAGDEKGQNYKANPRPQVPEKRLQSLFDASKKETMVNRAQSTVQQSYNNNAMTKMSDIQVYPQEGKRQVMSQNSLAEKMSDIQVYPQEGKRQITSQNSLPEKMSSKVPLSLNDPRFLKHSDSAHISESSSELSINQMDPRLQNPPLRHADSAHISESSSKLSINQMDPRLQNPPLRHADSAHVSDLSGVSIFGNKQQKVRRDEDIIRDASKYTEHTLKDSSQIRLNNPTMQRPGIESHKMKAFHQNPQQNLAQSKSSKAFPTNVPIPQVKEPNYLNPLANLLSGAQPSSNQDHPRNKKRIFDNDKSSQSNVTRSNSNKSYQGIPNNNNNEMIYKENQTASKAYVNSSAMMSTNNVTPFDARRNSENSVKEFTPMENPYMKNNNVFGLAMNSRGYSDKGKTLYK